MITWRVAVPVVAGAGRRPERARPVGVDLERGPVGGEYPGPGHRVGLDDDPVRGRARRGDAEAVVAAGVQEAADDLRGAGVRVRLPEDDLVPTADGDPGPGRGLRN